MMGYSMVTGDGANDRAFYHETTYKDPITLENFGEEPGVWSNKSEGGIWK